MKSKEWIKRLLLGKNFIVVEHEALGNLTMRICSSDIYIISQERVIVNLHSRIDRLEKGLGIISRTATQEERDKLGQL